MRKLRDWLKRLNNRVNIRQKLYSIMFLTYIYEPIDQHYKTERTGNWIEDNDLDIKVNSEHSYSKSLGSSRLEDERIEEVNNAKQCDTSHSRFSLPKLGLLPILYYLFTSIYHFIGLFRSTTLIFIQFNLLNLNKHLNCYIIGRLCFHVDMAAMMPYFELISNIYHLNWRLRTMVIEKGYRIDCVPFLIMSDEVDIILDKSDEDELKIRQCPANVVMNLPPDIARTLFVKILDDETGLPKYYLRPNRCEKSKRNLTEMIDRVMGWSVLLGTSVILSTLPIIMSSGLFDINYLINYPTCSPKLEQLAHEGKLSRWSANILSFDHRTLTIGFDVLINAIVWHDDLFAVLFPTSMSLLMIEDLLNYWRFLRRSLDKLLFMMENGKDCYDDEPLKWKRKSHIRHITSDSILTILEQIEGEWKMMSQRPRKHSTNKRVKILQLLIMDFFKQLRYYDRYISFIITTYLELWAILFIATGYLGVYTDSRRVLYIVRFVQIMGITSLGGLTIFMLRLSKHTKDAYSAICSIMALERDPDRKRDWSTILEIYTGNLKYGFTVYFRHQLSWMTLMNYIATTISFLAIIETYRRSDLWV